MGLFLFRFWPVLIPLLIYGLWLAVVARHARRAGRPAPRFRDGPWYWAVLASLLTAVGCFILLGTSIPQRQGDYIPPHMEHGQLVPGHVEPAP